MILLQPQSLIIIVILVNLIIVPYDGFANIVVLKIHRIQLNAKYVARVVMKVITKIQSVKNMQPI